MTRYFLIDSDSGFVWGSATAETPVAACGIVDAALGEHGRTYDEYSPRAIVTDSHYLVYSASDSMPEIADGQDAAQIAAVGALPLVARVAYREG